MSKGVDASNGAFVVIPGPGGCLNTLYLVLLG